MKQRSYFWFHRFKTFFGVFLGSLCFIANGHSMIGVELGLLFALNSYGLVYSIYIIFTSLTNYPLPYIAAKNHKVNKHPIIMFFVSPFKVPSLCFEMYRFYRKGLNAGVYEDVLFQLNQEPYFRDMEHYKKLIIVGFHIDILDEYSLSFASVLIEMCKFESENIPSKPVIEGDKFGVYTVEDMVIYNGIPYHVVKCGECGSRMTVRDQVMRLGVINKCKHHNIIPKLG